jgi:manganese-dependent inorganic pyrophosphatase
MDVNAAYKLAEIAGIECESYAQNMFAAGSNLRSKTDEEILYQDFKKFELGDFNIGIGQITSMNAEELIVIKNRLVPYIKEVYEHSDMDMIFFMLTDIIAESSEMLCYGKDSGELVEEAFHQEVKDGSVRLPGVVSRKKQLVPSFMMAISQL